VRREICWRVAEPTASMRGKKNDSDSRSSARASSMRAAASRRSPLLANASSSTASSEASW
jgi:hypothetical protein